MPPIAGLSPSPNTIERTFDVAEGVLGRRIDTVTPKLFEEVRTEDHGEVFTRRWIVDLILDLVGYTSDVDLATKVVVEPSCGTGAFLVPIIQRLTESARLYGRGSSELSDCVRAFELVDGNAELAKKAVEVSLEESGTPIAQAKELAAGWIRTGDFLLDSEVQSADFVVGNPPYVRLESVPPATMARYRSRLRTMRGRSDLYVGFIERGLSLLTELGALGFICSDRWMRNQYGGRLRELILAHFAVDTVLTMHDVNAFEAEVSAYPAVVVVRRGPQKAITVAHAGSGFGSAEANRLKAWIGSSTEPSIEAHEFSAARIDRFPSGAEFWPSGSPRRVGLVRELESRFPPLQDKQTGTRVGIGVASGADDVFITRDPQLVEKDRLLPLLTAPDTTAGVPQWSGTYLVNPWRDASLVDLDQFPKLARHFERNSERLRNRHVGRRRPAQWYRTIDRIDPALRGRPKLVMPDLKASSHPVLESGGLYPHHNLYFVVSDTWNLEVLGGLLLSDVANLFVGTYCVRMRGGCYRFQAQYLRRIRVPSQDSIPRSVQRDLADAFGSRNVEAATDAALSAYRLKVSTSLLRSLRTEW